MIMKTLFPTLLIALILTLFSGRAEGSLIEFTFGGNLEFMTVTGTPTGPWADIGVGDAFSVVYVFDWEAVDQDSDIANGIYAVQSLSVTIAGITLEAGFAEITINTLNPFMQEYLVFFDEFSFPTSGGIELTTALFLDSDELLTDIILDDWLLQEFGMGTEFSEFNGTPTSFTSRIVPAPG